VAVKLSGVDVTVRRIQAGDGPVLKSVRLAALEESPWAFGSTHAAEATLSDADWAARALLGATGSASITFLAVGDQSVVGIVGGYRPDPARPVVAVVSMWVLPAQRRTGIAGNLVQAVIGWARERNATSVELWVTRSNEAAVKLYEASGFEPTGDHRPLPSDPCRNELRMRRDLD
jgi:ribosomal protein S18 acetylase RimI-like enzyme